MDPGRTGATQMIASGQRIRIDFAMPDVEIDRLRFQAVLWTWLHLGAIGRRSRRGYGSLLWTGGDALSDLGLNPLGPPEPGTSLEEKLTDYLKEGLIVVERIMGQPSREPRRPSSSFRLESLDQVFVGSNPV